MQEQARSAADLCDVVVIGGGPAGSTAAALLARRGHSVIALEKAHHPRFHIGESLLPMNLPIFERLGVLDKVRALGVFKRGRGLRGRQRARLQHLFAFARAIGKSPPHAYQVWRQDFDQMLFEHARELRRRRARGPRGAQHRAARRRATRGCRCAPTPGAQLRHPGALRGRRQRPRHVPVRQEAPAAQEPRAPERGDLRPFPRRGRARGRGRRQHQHLPLRARLDVDDSAARRRDERRRGVLAGLPEAAQGPHGRVPAGDAAAEPGAVGAHAGARSSSATRCASPATIPTTRKRMGGPGWVLVGDAFAFLDPVFSSGVYLAMSGAEQAAQLVDAALREPAREPALLRKLERRQRAGMKRFSFFIYRFNEPVMRAAVPQPAQRLAARAGRDLDAGGRPVRHPARCCGGCSSSSWSTP